jgi:glycerate kinase
MKKVDLVITGEGRLDGQTINGKTPIGVARVAKKENIPVIAISAIFGEGIEKVTSSGIDAVFNMLQNLNFSIENDTEKWLQFVSEQITRLIKLKIDN